MLILNGELNSLTPAAGGAHIARQIGPDANTVVAANTVHLVELSNSAPCGSTLVRCFITSPQAHLDSGGSSHIPAVRAVPGSAHTLNRVTPATGDAPLSIRRLAAVAVAEAGDATVRFSRIDGRNDLGLRGESISYDRDATRDLTTPTGRRHRRLRPRHGHRWWLHGTADGQRPRLQCRLGFRLVRPHQERDLRAERTRSWDHRLIVRPPFVLAVRSVRQGSSMRTSPNQMLCINTMTTQKTRRGADVKPDDGDEAPSTRRLLLAAVIAIAGRQGQHAVTYRSVADYANMSHGLVRHYFGTRQAMIAEAFELTDGEDLADVHLATESIENFAEGLFSSEDDLARGAGASDEATRVVDRIAKVVEKQAVLPNPAQRINSFEDTSLISRQALDQDRDSAASKLSDDLAQSLGTTGIE